jgi:hypothetical protein
MRELDDLKVNADYRDCVQFVPFNQINHDPLKIQAEVLQEIPGQVVAYYTQQRLLPESL